MTAFATFHLSPITVLAIFSDVAYGSKVYLEQLSDRLKEQGIIKPETTIDGATDLIRALEHASGSAVDMFDQPPISIDGLRKTLEETTSAVANIDPSKLIPSSEIDQLWTQMELAAEDQNASIWDISATMSMVALNNIQAAGHGTFVGLEIAGNMFSQHIIGHYWDGLREIERQGLIPTLSDASQPYLEAVWSNFSMNEKTWTEQLLSGDLLRWGWSRLSWPKLIVRQQLGRAADVLLGHIAADKRLGNTFGLDGSVHDDFRLESARLPFRRVEFEGNDVSWTRTLG